MNVAVSCFSCSNCRAAPRLKQDNEIESQIYTCDGDTEKRLPASFPGSFGNGCSDLLGISLADPSRKDSTLPADSSRWSSWRQTALGLVASVLYRRKTSRRGTDRGRKSKLSVWNCRCDAVSPVVVQSQMLGKDPKSKASCFQPQKSCRTGVPVESGSPGRKDKAASRWRALLSDRLDAPPVKEKVTGGVSSALREGIMERTCLLVDPQAAPAIDGSTPPHPQHVPSARSSHRGNCFQGRRPESSVLLRPSAPCLCDGIQLEPPCKILRFWQVGAEVSSSQTSLVCRFPHLCSLPWTSLEWSALFLSRSLPSVVRGSLGLQQGERLRWGTNKYTQCSCLG